MKIIIVGCGKVGRTISEQLDGEGHSITVVDINPRCVNRLAEHLDVMGVEGDGASRDVLKEAGVENSDLVIAVADADELIQLYVAGRDSSVRDVWIDFGGVCTGVGCTLILLLLFGAIWYLLGFGRHKQMA